MFRHQTLTGLPKYSPKNMNQASFTVYYTAIWRISLKAKPFDTTNLETVGLLHIYSALYTVNSILRFTFIFTVVCSKTIMLWVFLTKYKISSVRIVLFVLTTLYNDKYPFRRVRVNEYSALENSTNVANLLVYEFRILM